MSESTQKMKSRIILKGSYVRKEPGRPAEALLRPGVKICVERGRLYTESYKATEGEPEVIRRAKALAHVLDNMTVFIAEGERIVGNYASDPGSLPVFPEIAQEFYIEGITGPWQDRISEKDRQELLDICKYWEGKSVDDRVRDILPDELKGYVDFSGLNWANFFGEHDGLSCSNFKKLFQVGLNGIIKEIEQRLAELKAEVKTVYAQGYIDQRYNLEAMLIACQAAARWGKRYADKARELLKTETDDKRKKELGEIAEICDQVPANPPRTFHEALQDWFFIHLITREIEIHGSGEGSRFDQNTYPLYKKDKDEGRISYDQAQELVEFLWLKLEEIGDLRIPQVYNAIPGGSLFQTLNLCGVTPDGTDATNEVSYIMLDATIAMKTRQPTFALRYHPTIDPGIIDKAIDCLRTGVGFPAFFNDSGIVPYLVNRGIPLEEARDYGIAGCMEWIIPGKCMRTNPCNHGFLNLGKCFELALTQGHDSRTGKQLGYLTADPLTFTSIEDVMQAYLKQVSFGAEKHAKISWIMEQMYHKHMQRPFASTLLDGCIGNGMDCTYQSYHSFGNILALGLINAANSMTAVKKLVFEDKLVSMAELLDALKNSFEGKEDLRQRLLQAPKYGNDDDYADTMAREVHYRSEKEVEKFPDFYGRPHSLSGGVVSTNYAFGRACGATPDGRKAKDVYADGSLSPVAGTDKRGPTAVVKSIGKVPLTHPQLVNQKFMPQHLEGENKKLFAAYLKTWGDVGSYHIQFNIVDKDTLLNAQANPEKYPDLIVRVAGYSAYFVDLQKGVQDDIIARTEQAL